MDMYSLLCLKWITRKDLLCIAQNSAQYHVVVWMGGDLGAECVCVCVCVCACVAESLQCSPETVTAVIGYTPIQNKKCFLCFFFSPKKG